MAALLSTLQVSSIILSVFYETVQIVMLLSSPVQKIHFLSCAGSRSEWISTGVRFLLAREH